MANITKIETINITLCINQSNEKTQSDDLYNEFIQIIDKFIEKEQQPPDGLLYKLQKYKKETATKKDVI